MSKNDSNSDPRRKERSISRYEFGEIAVRPDFLAAEEPLEIRVVFGPVSRRKDRSLSITMRTPGNDRKLAVGFLVGEGVIRNVGDVEKFEETGPFISGEDRTNQLCIHLSQSVSFDFGSLQRNFYTTSSCGICGKASLDAVRAHLGQPIAGDLFCVAAKTICQLPDSLRKQQETFAQTGGLHASGLFDDRGEILSVYEDVGRHNALDKLVGGNFLDGNLPLSKHIVVVSGRASFELVQKTIAAGIPILVAVGAPSSLAVELAEEFGVTLIGFASSSRFNIYSHTERILAS